MRRLPTLLVAVLGLLLVLPGLALADEVATDGTQVLAVDDAPSGPNPMPRDAEDNPARDLGDYGDRETPFTWAAAWLLAGLGFVGVSLMLLVYRFRVLGPSRDGAST